MAAAGLLTILFAPLAAAAYPSGGRMSVTDPSQTRIIREGGSATYFSLLLPKGAHCAGDARHDGYRVFSYLIPHGVDPHIESFITTLPSRWYGMYSQSEYYMGFPAPDTGAIDDIPNNLVWSRLSTGLLLSTGQDTARWDAGLACVTEHDVVQNTWSATFEFQRSSADPGGFTWAVISAPGAKPQSEGVGGWAIILFAGAAAFLALAFLFSWMSRRGRGTSDRVDPTGLGGAADTEHVERHFEVNGPIRSPYRGGGHGRSQDRSLSTSGE